MKQRADYWKKAGLTAAALLLVGMGIGQLENRGPAAALSVPDSILRRYLPVTLRMEGQLPRAAGKRVEAEGFSGSIALLGAEHASPGGAFRLSLHIYSAGSAVMPDRVETDIWYDRKLFAFDHAVGLAEPAVREPGRVRVAAKASHPFPPAGRGEYRKSRVAELYFRPIAPAGEGRFVLQGTKFTRLGESLSVAHLTYGQAAVRIHPRQGEDRNGDGLVSIGDMALGAGGSGEQKKRIANKLALYPYKHVVVIGLDGAGNSVSPDAPYYRLLTAHALRKSDRFALPNLRSILNGGAVSYTASSTLPTSSSPNWGAMLTGVDYAKHGISNTRSGEAYYNGPYPTVFSRLREMVPERRLALFAHWDHLLNGHVEPAAGVTVFSGSDDKLVKDFADYVDSGQAADSALMFLVLDEVDNAGHDRGWFTRSYYRALQRADRKVGEVYAALRRNGLLDDTLVLLVADHGGGTSTAIKAAYRSHSHSHGGKQAATVFFAAAGRTVTAGGVTSGGNREHLLSGGHTRDVAATILAALGDERPIGDSRPLPGMFRPAAAGQRRGGIFPASSARPFSPGKVRLQSQPSAPGSALTEYSLSLEGTGIRTKAAVVRIAPGAGSGPGAGVSPALRAVPLAAGVRAYLTPDRNRPGAVNLIVVAAGTLPQKAPLVRLALPKSAAGAAAIQPLQAAVADSNGFETLPAVELSPSGGV